jgi:hypothetical protein
MVVQEEEDEGAEISIKNLLDGKEYTVPKKKIYAKRPHITADNHFSGENVMDYIGKIGFGITTTCCHDRFPKGLKDYFHHKKVLIHDKRTRVSWFKQPSLPSRGWRKAMTRKLTQRSLCLFSLLVQLTFQV